MDQEQTNINRLKELEKILDKLKKSSNDDRTDIDLILGYLEKFVNNPADSGGSEKVMGFEIRDDINTMSKNLPTDMEKN